MSRLGVEKIICRVIFTLVTLQAQAEIRVVDYNGDELLLSKAATRVVALSPHIVENVFAAGAGDLLVGAVDYSDYPPAARDIPSVGGFASLNREALLLLQADLVIAWGSGNGDTLIEQVRALDIPVFVDEPQQLSDVARSLNAIGKLTGREELAQQAATDFLETLNQLQNQYKNKTDVSVLYQIWHSPIQTVNNDHIISKVITLCGGVNAFGDAITAAPIINRETVIARDPDVIIGSGSDGQRPAWLDSWHAWPDLSAVKNRHLFFIHPDYLQRHTPRILLGAEEMCRQLQRVRKSEDGRRSTEDRK